MQIHYNITMDMYLFCLQRLTSVFVIGKKVVYNNISLLSSVTNLVNINCYKLLIKNIQKSLLYSDYYINLTLIKNQIRLIDLCNESNHKIKKKYILWKMC